MKFGHNILQILAGRLAGIGKSGLDFVNAFIGIPSTLANRAFYKTQAYLSKVSTEIAQASCIRAALELRKKHNTADSEFLEVTVSYANLGVDFLDTTLLVLYPWKLGKY